MDNNYVFLKKIIRRDLEYFPHKEIISIWDWYAYPDLRITEFIHGPTYYM